MTPFPSSRSPQVVTFHLREGMTVEDFLAASCLKKSLNAAEHFVRVKRRRQTQQDDAASQGGSGSAKYFVPHRADLIETYVSQTGILWAFVIRLQTYWVAMFVAGSRF